MNEPEQEITLWMQRLSEQPEASMQVIWNNFYSRLVEHARKKMGGMPRRQLDEEDIATDAMHSLFQGVQAGKFPDLNNRNDLWKLLLTITTRKAGKAIRGNLAQKRGGGDVRGESIFYRPDNAGGEGLGNIVGSEPTAEFAEDVLKSCEQLLGNLADDQLREIAILKLEGYSSEEIATRQECAVRTVERKLNRIRGIWDPTLSTLSGLAKPMSDKRKPSQ